MENVCSAVTKFQVSGAKTSQRFTLDEINSSDKESKPQKKDPPVCPLLSSRVHGSFFPNIDSQRIFSSIRW